MGSTETLFVVRGIMKRFPQPMYLVRGMSLLCEPTWLSGLAGATLTYDYGSAERLLQLIPELKDYDSKGLYEIIAVECNFKVVSAWAVQPPKMVEAPKIILAAKKDLEPIISEPTVEEQIA